MSVSVLILTLNEEANLQRCLDSVRWSDDVIVFDSFSTDETVEIARKAGARVVQRKFDNEKAHREASLQLDFRYPWVYNPDADEVATPELQGEIRAAAAAPENPIVAYRVRSKNMFMGQWVKHSSLYPTWIVRLFRPQALRFERTINLRYVIDGPEGRLNGHLLHFSFNKGMEWWVAKHNTYSTAEAREMLRSLTGPWTPGDLFSTDGVRRRRALKELSFRVPFRGPARFLYSYFFRLGCLDGMAGYHYCALMAFYEELIAIKAKDLVENGPERP